MIKASIVVDEFYKNNRLFDINDPISNRDNCLYPFYHLRKELAEKKNVDLSTYDINTVSDSDVVIFNDMPKIIPQKVTGQRFLLLALESIAVHPINFQEERYKHFDKVFTWKDDIIDKKKVIKINYSFLIKPDNVFDMKNKTKFTCIFANRKRSTHKLELYSERTKAIQWFENNHPDEIDLYGSGWEKFYGRNFIDKIIQSLKYKHPVPANPYSCYKGFVSDKISQLKNYKFSICYENIRDMPGYITEKIFDCFFAGCVPVYWGANNVTDHIPADCFIDKREFSDYEKLYRHLKAMTDDEYQRYIDAIQRFLLSDRAYPFTSEFFSKTIASEL